MALRYQQPEGLGNLLSISSEEIQNLSQLPENRDIVARLWWAKTIGYETRAAIRQQQAAQDKKIRYQQEIGQKKIKQLQNNPDSQYGDAFNALVCKTADNLNTSDLKDVGDKVFTEITGNVADQEIVYMLTEREITRQQQRLTKFNNFSLEKLNDPEKAANYSLLTYELDRRKTDTTWETKVKLSDVIFRGLSGETVNLITMLCTINEFDYQGGYNLNPNLNAYLQNPKVEPVPLIIEEMVSIVKLFNYYNINCTLTMYVADTDYTEIGANGPVTLTNLNNLQRYLGNLKEFVERYIQDIKISPISSLTDNNPTYSQTKGVILEWVSRLRDPEFNQKWGKKYEDDTERRYETFSKKKLYPTDQSRRKSLEVARNIWAVNAAQGAAISSLGPNTVLLSSERRSRDQNYVVDSLATLNFPPVLYVLKAAENWNLKIVNQSIFQAD